MEWYISLLHYSNNFKQILMHPWAHYHWFYLNTQLSATTVTEREQLWHKQIPHATHSGENKVFSLSCRNKLKFLYCLIEEKCTQVYYFFPWSVWNLQAKNKVLPFAQVLQELAKCRIILQKQSTCLPISKRDFSSQFYLGFSFFTHQTESIFSPY